MGAINYGRVVIGGLLAGLVFNACQSLVHLLLFAEQSAQLTTSMGLPEPTGGQIGLFWIVGFIAGIATIWVYAAIRPRFGAGVGTAVKAGLLAFVLAELVPTLFYSWAGLFGLGEALPFTIATLVVLVISAIAGAWPYTEVEAGTAAPAAPAAPSAPAGS